MKQQEALCKELGDNRGLSESLGNQAAILIVWRRFEEAIKYLKQVETFCKEFGDKASLSACLGNQAMILAECGQFEEAMKYYTQVEFICKEIGYKEGLARTFFNQAILLTKDMRRPQDGLLLAQKAFDISVEHGFKALSRQIKWTMYFINAAAQADKIKSYFRKIFSFLNNY